MADSRSHIHDAELRELHHHHHHHPTEPHQNPPTSPWFGWKPRVVWGVSEAGQVLLAAASCVCESRCLYGPVVPAVQSVGPSVWRKTGRGWWGALNRGSTGERGHFKGLSPVSNSSQRDYTMLSSLFNLRLKRGLFVSLVFHCSSVCHSTTSGLQGKYGSRFR